MKTRQTEQAHRLCRKKFLSVFPKGFEDSKYNDWERNYKWEAHLKFQQQLNKKQYAELLAKHRYGEIAQIGIGIESKTNLLFSFEKMALRDAVKSPKGAKLFSTGLYAYLYGDADEEERFLNFTEMLSALPRKQTRVKTWPLATVFGFIACPDEFIFLKPRVTQKAAIRYGFDFKYDSKVAWATYQSLLQFAAQIKHDLKELKPKDMIDLQSFIWVLGSEEYE
jgi:hypothetical protein